MRRQTRYMERTNSMARGKRSLEGDEDKQPERKRPALASVIVEALKVDSLQKLCSSLEPILRRVVSEEVERALAKLGPPRLNGRSSPKRIEGPDGRSLRLHFRSRLSLPLFTGGKVEGEQGAAIHIVLVDSNTGHVVTTGPEASVKLDVVVLEGDFNNEDDEDWTQEEFEIHVVKEREGKRPLLTGDLQVTLKEGVGTLGDLTFTDNSSWIRSRKFRLGLKVASGYCEGIRVREAKTEAFTVKDHRGELYKKHYPPALNDEVWRLEKIGKDGSFHKRLNKEGILTVEDFLRLLVRDQQKLRNVYVDTLVKKAYDNWNQVIEYDGKSLLNFKQNRRSSARNELQMGVIDCPNALDHQLQLPLLPAPVPTEQVHSGLQVGGYNDNQSTRYSGQSQLVNSNSRNQFDNTQFVSHDQLINNSQQPQSSRNDNNVVGLALGPPQSSVVGFQSIGSSMQSSNLNPFDDWTNNRDKGVDDLFTEEEIRIRSNEMLENEDMQHLLRVFSMGGHASINVTEDGGFGFPNYMPSPMPNFVDEDRSRPGKAVVGWLKIKAAMRWGFFVRKKAAERRAQLVELEEE
ncbi:calmodulin-binding protein 60 C-like isoform X3 [Durio zibethinus]|uniref:Calmodulin-binding protein 60 C-like isoform X3 n=1 Tax=Durio zibethinus TaxID=66656 RepID=A0A6P5ZSJ1_DURZI|nr:calmodulin-binding protein 60 C-like isoform X3 [Durio zibethinus]